MYHDRWHLQSNSNHLAFPEHVIQTLVFIANCIGLFNLHLLENLEFGFVRLISF